MSEEPRRLNHYRSVDEFGEPDGIYGCAAPDLQTAREWSNKSDHDDLTLIDAGPLPLEDSPGRCRTAIAESPLLGPDWLPLASVISGAAEYSRLGSFWQMNTYAPQAGYQAAGSPFVQGLTDHDGSHVIEVGGIGRGDGWTSQETRAAFALLGWSGVNDSDVNNLTRTLPSTWTGERVALLILDLFVAVYGHELSYPVAFEGSDHIRRFARQHLAVLSGSQILVAPAALSAWQKAPDQDPVDATNSESSASMGAKSGIKSTSQFSPLIDELCEKYDFPFPNYIREELELHSANEPASWIEDETCQPHAHEYRYLNTTWAAFFRELTGHIPHLKSAASAWDSFASRRSHTGHLIDRFGAMMASNPRSTLSDHYYCGKGCGSLTRFPGRFLCVDHAAVAAAV